MRRLASFFGAIILFLLGCVICTLLALFVVGAFCTTWPLLRLSPRDRRLRAALDVAMALSGLVAAVQGPPQAGHPKAPNDAP